MVPLLLTQINVREHGDILHRLSTLCQGYDYFKYLSYRAPLSKVHLDEMVEGLLTTHNPWLYFMCTAH